MFWTTKLCQKQFTYFGARILVEFNIFELNLSDIIGCVSLIYQSDF